MTEKEIMEMKAGLELDALVHEHIFGVPREKIYYTIGGKEYTTATIGLYSTDESSAFHILQLMSKSNYHVNIQNCHADEGKPWCVFIYSNEYDDRIHDGEAEGEFAESVCKAALVAKLGLGKD